MFHRDKYIDMDLFCFQHKQYRHNLQYKLSMGIHIDCNLHHHPNIHLYNHMLVHFLCYLNMLNNYLQNLYRSNIKQHKLGIMM